MRPARVNSAGGRTGGEGGGVEKLGVGLIGCGSMGRALGAQLVQVERARLVGVSDVDPAAAAAAAEELGAPAATSNEELLDRPGLDAVVIASPPFQHRPLAEAAAARAKHVFVEKPLAASVADCDAILQAVEKAGVCLMVGQVLRYYPCWARVLEIVAAGELGEPWAVAVTRISGGWGGWAQPWRNKVELCGGILMEVNAHEIDFMCQIGGDVERVYAEADHRGEDPADYPNLCFVSLRFRGGAIGMLHSSTVAAVGDLSGKVQGSKGSLMYTNGFGGAGEIRWAQRDGEARVERIADLGGEQPVRRELRLFVESVLDGTPPPIPGWEGRRNVAVAEAAYESARRGVPITPAQ